MTEQERLDAAVAKAAEWMRGKFFKDYYAPKSSSIEDSIQHPSEDWRALMAAVERLEPVYRFQRMPQQSEWNVDGPGTFWRYCFWGDEPLPSFAATEQEALARLIAAAVEHRDA